MLRTGHPRSEVLLSYRLGVLHFLFILSTDMGFLRLRKHWLIYSMTLRNKLLLHRCTLYKWVFIFVITRSSVDEVFIKRFFIDLFV